MTYDRYDSKIFVATEYEIEYEIIFRKNGSKLVEIRVEIYLARDEIDVSHDFKTVQNIFKDNHKHFKNKIFLNILISMRCIKIIVDEKW